MPQRKSLQSAEQEDETAARRDFWSMQGDFVHRHHIEPRVQLYVPPEATSPIPPKYIDVTRSTYTDLDIAQEKRIDDYWKLDENKNLSDPWIHEVCTIKRFTSKRIHVVRERLTKIQTTSRPDHIWPKAWTIIGKAAQKKERQEWALEKPELEHARSLRDIYSIDPSYEDFKDIIKNARQKLKTPMAPAMPCKSTCAKSCYRETVV